jgi:hypothetical protein
VGKTPQHRREVVIATVSRDMPQSACQ